MISLSHILPSGLRVDREAGMIYGIPVITGGMVAVGHGCPAFTVDSVLVKQVMETINAKPNGVKSRFTHPEIKKDNALDSLEVLMGKVVNARVENNRAIVDFKMGSYADPVQANKIYGLAEDAPEDAGLSIMPDESFFEQVGDESRLRVTSMSSVDWVGTPAANPQGMLSKSNPSLASRDMAMPTPEQIELLRTFVEGLSDDPGVDEITAAIEGLDDVQRMAYDVLGGPIDALPDAALAEDGDDEEVLPEGKAPEEDEPALSEAKPDTKKIALAATNAETDRCNAINEMVALGKLDNKLAIDAIKDKTSVSDFRKVALTEAQKGREVVAMGVTVGDNNNLVSLSAGMSDAIALRANAKTFKGDNKPHERANEFVGLSLVGMARNVFFSNGVKDAHSLPTNEIVNMMAPAYARKKYPALAQSTDVFDNIMADTINKSLQAAYLDGPSTWSQWARRTTTPDFKTITRAALSESPDLASHEEGEELKYVTLGDKKETYNLTEYKAGLRLTRQAIINDDLDAFGRIPQLLGEAARRKEDDVAYAIITANAVMNENGNALFSSGNANLTAAGGSITVATLQVGFNAMFIQKGPKDAAFLELVPAYLLVPSSLKSTADQIINSTADPAISNSAAINPFANSLTVIPSARLNADSAVKWYLFADPSRIDTIELAFLQGEETPVLHQEEDFDTDDMKFKVRHTVAAKAIDFRGVYQNDGTA
jgi:hypothetical protein